MATFQPFIPQPQQRFSRGFYYACGCCILLLTLLLFPRGVNGQKTTSDISDLRRVWNNQSVPATDSLRLQAANLLLRYYENVSIDSAEMLLQELEEQAKIKHTADWFYTLNYEKGYSSMSKGDLEKALPFYRSSLNYAKKTSYGKRANAYSAIGLVYGMQNKLDSAFYYFDRSIKLIEKYQLTNQEANMGVYANQALCYSLVSEELKSMDSYLKIIQVGNKSHQVSGHLGVGVLFMGLGLKAEAKAHFETALTLAREVNLPSQIMISSTRLMILAPDEATLEALLNEGLAIANGEETKAAMLNLYGECGRRALELNSLSLASWTLDAALAIAKELHDEANQLFLSLQRASLLSIRHEYSASLEILQSIEPKLIVQKKIDNLMELYRIKSKIFENQHQIDSAFYYLQKKIALSEQLVEKHVLVKDMVSTYLGNRAEQERKILDLEKQHALQEASIANSKIRQSYIILMLASLLFSILIMVYVVLLRQKEKYSTILEHEKRNLEWLNNKLELFSSIISHDVLSNLNLMLSTGNVLVGRRPDSKDKLVQYYEATQTIIYRLRDYCEELLKEAASTAPSTFICQEEANSLLAQLQQQFQQPLAEADFELVVAAPLAALQLPKVVVHQLLQNILTNALKYVPQIGVRPSIHFSSGLDAQGQPYWQITDNGPGFATQAHLQPGSHGLGLQKVREALAGYGYTLVLSKRQSGGSCLEIRRLTAS